MYSKIKGVAAPRIRSGTDRCRRQQSISREVVASIAAPQVPVDTSVDVSDAPNASTRTHLGVATDARYGHWLARSTHCAACGALAGASLIACAPSGYERFLGSFAL